jgi:hypothetical protein
MNCILKRKNIECAACVTNSVRICVENIYKMGCLEGSGVPVLYIGRTVPNGEIAVVLTDYHVPMHTTGMLQLKDATTKLSKLWGKKWQRR